MCSELCGVNHYFMPIEVHAVSKEAFAAWVEEAKQKFAGDSHPRVDMASNGSSRR
jgi:cytochrome c oxidase subunit 2